MLRKILAVSVLAVAMTSAACNSITNVVETDPQVTPPERAFCLDDLRAVEIMSPGEGEIIYNGQLVTVGFEVEEFCAGWTASLRVSYDAGQTFIVVASAKNVSSLTWQVPNRNHLQPVISVSILDSQGAVLAEHALTFLYRDANATPRRGQYRD